MLQQYEARNRVDFHAVVWWAEVEAGGS